MNLPLRIFVGYDSRAPAAFDVCVNSILRHSSVQCDIHALRIDDLKAGGIYKRPNDPLASTEFTYTRFLVPFLCSYKGWALFLDSDFLITSDVAELRGLSTPDLAILCVKHNYIPSSNIKMDGQLQAAYPRKNWSSFVLWNCEHNANSRLTPSLVNTADASFLHRFHWINDQDIGEVPSEWNWLEGEMPRPAGVPKGIHFTRGGPWLPLYSNVDYAHLWHRERELSLPHTASE